MTKRRWEVGSLFHLASYPAGQPRHSSPWELATSRLTGCGRDALRLVAGLGRYRRIWMPSYLCQEVVESLVSSPVEVLCYADSPLQAVPDFSQLSLRDGDAIFLVNYFGLRQQASFTIPGNVEVGLIEDHTHAPNSRWAHASTADFCIASLRKLYPIPDGGALWSPKGHALPDEPAPAPHLVGASSRKLVGMVLKSLYLEGHVVDKDVFRAELAGGEAGLYGQEISGISPVSRAALSTFPLALWRRERGQKFALLRDALSLTDGVALLQPADTSEVPFSAMLVFEEVEVASRVHQRLIVKGVYASRLWPLHDPILAGVSEEDKRLSLRMFSIPLDMRYSVDDVSRTVEILSQAIAETVGETAGSGV